MSLCEGASRLATSDGLHAAGIACLRFSTGLNWTPLCEALAPPFAGTIDNVLQGTNSRSMLFKLLNFFSSCVALTPSSLQEADNEVQGAGAGGRVAHNLHSNAAYISNNDDVRAYTLALLRQQYCSARVPAHVHIHPW